MKYIQTFIAVLILTACASSTITDGSSFTDPGWNGSPAKSIMVQVVNAPLGEQKAIEDGITTALAKRGLNVGSSYRLFLPTRDYSLKEKNQMINDSGYETRLTITPYDREMVGEYIPPSSGPFGTFGYGSGGGGRFGGGIGYGIDFGRGYSTEEPIVRYKTDLYIIQDNRRIWTGDYTARGASGMSYDQMGEQFADEIIEKLVADGLI